VPLTELVHYFNKRNRLDCGGDGADVFEIVDRRARAYLGGRVLGSLYQPVVDRGSGRVIGHEAFLHALDGEAPGLPAQSVFLDAHDDGELVRVDRLARTLHALNFLLEREQQGGFLALNVHPQLIRAVRDHHGHVFESVLSRCGLTPDRIVLELADDGFEPPSVLAAAIAEYHERGYRIALDNFGRHSSDLERLEVLSPDIVKLDRNLIRDDCHLSLSRRVASGLAAEIRSLGMQVVGQGIERSQQLEIARDAGVDWLQGYLIAAPAAGCQPITRPQRVRVAA